MGRFSLIKFLKYVCVMSRELETLTMAVHIVSFKSGMCVHALASSFGSGLHSVIFLSAAAPYHRDKKDMLAGGANRR